MQQCDQRIRGFITRCVTSRPTREHILLPKFSMNLFSYLRWTFFSRYLVDQFSVDFFHVRFNRAMRFSAKRGIAIACRLSVRLSVCLSVCLSVTLVNCNHIGSNSLKIISPLVSMWCSLFATPTWRVCSKGNTPKFGPKVTHPLLIWASETFDRK